MSTSYDIVCITCMRNAKSEEDAYATFLHLQDTRDPQIVASLTKIAKHAAVFYDGLCEVKLQNEIEVRAWWSGQIDIGWFSQHASHSLVVMSEHGHRAEGICGFPIPKSGFCILDQGHAEDHHHWRKDS